MISDRGNRFLKKDLAMNMNQNVLYVYSYYHLKDDKIKNHSGSNI